MTITKITVKQIQSLKAQNKPYKVRVDTGLYIRVAKSGLKSWIVRYVTDGIQHNHPLSKPWGLETDGGHLSLKDARTESENIRAIARSGINYKVMLREQKNELERQRADEITLSAQRIKAKVDEDKTVKDLFQQWITDGVKRKDGNAELLRLFNKDIFPSIGDIPIKMLSEHDLRDCLRKMVARGVNRLTVIAFNDLTQMFFWAEKRQPWRKLLADGNPVELIDIEKIVSQGYDFTNQRRRILSIEEIVELNHKLTQLRKEYDNSPNKKFATHPLNPVTEIALWLMLSTLCRVGEISMARWEHINFEKNEWFIPKENVKGSRNDFMIFFSDFTRHQLFRLRELTGNSEWCFPATNNSGHVCVKSISKQVGDRQTIFKKLGGGSQASPMKNRTKNENALVLSNGTKGNWTPHDLRRTGATMMQSLGVTIEHIDRCQNHVLPGSKAKRHYLLWEYADEKRNAWKLLGEKLNAIIS